MKLKLIEHKFFWRTTPSNLIFKEIFCTSNWISLLLMCLTLSCSKNWPHLSLQCFKRTHKYIRALDLGLGTWNYEKGQMRRRNMVASYVTWYLVCCQTDMEQTVAFSVKFEVTDQHWCILQRLIGNCMKRKLIKKIDFEWRNQQYLLNQGDMLVLRWLKTRLLGSALTTSCLRQHTWIDCLWRSYAFKLQIASEEFSSQEQISKGFCHRSY